MGSSSSKDDNKGMEPMDIEGSKKKEEIDSDDPPPPDNGPWYCSLCNWYGSMFSRFDAPFIAFFTI